MSTLTDRTGTVGTIRARIGHAGQPVAIALLSARAPPRTPARCVARHTGSFAIAGQARAHDGVLLMLLLGLRSAGTCGDAHHHV